MLPNGETVVRVCEAPMTTSESEMIPRETGAVSTSSIILQEDTSAKNSVITSACAPARPDRVTLTPAELVVTLGGQGQDSKYMLDPHGSMHMVWDILILLLIIYSGLSIPFRIGFNVFPEKAQFDPARLVEYFVDALFFIDIAVTFRTCLYLNGERTSNAVVIAKQYLAFWFWIDFISVLPLGDIVSEDSEGGFDATYLKAFRLLRLARLGRIARIWERWEKHFGHLVNRGVTRAIKFIVIVCFVSHGLACMFFYVAYLNNFNEHTWIHDYDVDQGKLSSLSHLPHPRDWATAEPGDVEAAKLFYYWVSLYWAFATVTTVGFGDITPGNHDERWVCVFAMLVGGVVYAYVVGNVAVLVKDFAPKAQLYEEKMISVNQYMQDRRVPRRLAFAVREHYEHSYLRQQLEVDERDILNDLTPSLRTQVVKHANEDIFLKLPQFAGLTHGFLDHVDDLQPIQGHTFGANEVIFDHGDESTHLYILSKGRVIISSHGVRLCEITAPSLFGESCLFGSSPEEWGARPPPRNTQATASNICEVYPVENKLLIDIADRHPTVRLAFDNFLSLRHKLLNRSRRLSIVKATQPESPEAGSGDGGRGGSGGGGESASEEQVGDNKVSAELRTMNSRISRLDSDLQSFMRNMELQISRLSGVIAMAALRTAPDTNAETNPQTDVSFFGETESCPGDELTADDTPRPSTHAPLDSHRSQNVVWSTQE